MDFNDVRDDGVAMASAELHATPHTHTHTHTHNHFTALWILSGTTQVSHQLDHMQIICTSLQITMPVPHHSVFTG